MELIITNDVVYYFIFIWAIFGVVSSIGRLFAPNYMMRKYVSGEWKMPRDISVRISGFIVLLLTGYITLVLFGVLK